MKRNNKGQFTKENQINPKIIITGIICISIIECVALYHGINGKVLSGVLMIIAGLCGWSLPQLKFK